MLTIMGRRNSFNVQKVMWLVHELELPHVHVPAGGDFGVLDTAEFLALNPHGRIPVMRDGTLVVWESHAILRYLAATYGAGRFWDDDPARRSAVDGWMDWSQTSLQPDLLGGVFWSLYRTPAHLQDKPAIAAKVSACATSMRLLDRILEGRDYLCGDRLSLADIPTGAALYRYYTMEIDRPDVPNVEAWYRRLQERPAYREHVMMPFGAPNGSSPEQTARPAAPTAA